MLIMNNFIQRKAKKMAILNTGLNALPAGTITRAGVSATEYGKFEADVLAGSAVVYDSAKGTFRAMKANDKAADVYGIAANVVPSTAQEGAIFVRGYIAVKVASDVSPVRGKPVYVRIKVSGGKVIGAFESAQTTDETEALPNAVWALDGKSVDGLAEIRIL